MKSTTSRSHLVNRPMKRSLEIDGRVQAFVDRNGAIKSHPFDQRWKAEMSARCAIEGMRCFDGHD